MSNKNTLILGLGNDILTDDAIGPKLASDLRKLYQSPDVIIRTESCGGIEIMEYLRGFRIVVIIDAIKTPGGRPGDVYHFVPSRFRETLHLSSLHDISFLTALRMGSMLYTDMPSDIHIIAVEIIEDMVFSNDLTPEIMNKYPRILEEVTKMIKYILPGLK